MTLLKLLPSIAIISFLHAQEEWKPTAPQNSSEVANPFGPKAPPTPIINDDSQVLIPSLLGLVIQKQNENLSHLSGQIITGQIPAAFTLLTQLEPQLSRPLSEKGLNFLIEVILSHYDTQGHPVIDVIVPEQDISDGFLTLEILEGKVGTVGLQKSKWSREKNLAPGIWIKSGDPILARTLQRDLDWLSRNPFRQASLFATPGNGPAIGDFLIGLKEQRPWRLFAGYQNNGSETIGEDLFSVGFNWGNAFNQDHLLNYQFTNGADTSDFRAHAFTWEIPLHQYHHFLRVTGARADVTSSESGIDSDGGYRELGLSIGRQLDRWHGLRQEVSLGLEWKNIDNFATFNSVFLPGAEVDLWQIHLAYQAQGKLWDGRLNLSGDLIASPGNLSGKNSDHDFQQFRSGADSQYAILRASSRWQKNIWENWPLKLAFQGQYSPNKLLPSEQLGLGGANTIRGYSERELLADSGFVLSAEVGTPVWQWKSVNAQAVTFLDHGTGWRHGKDRQSLTAAGLGLRVESTHAVRAKIDWASTRDGESQWHFGFLLSF